MVDPEPDSEPRRRVPWGAVAGVGVLAYVVVEAVALLSVDDRNRFNRWGAAMGSVGARLVLSGVILAAVFHTLDGLRRLVVGLASSVEAHDEQLRLVVVFVTWALAVPAAAVVTWPWWKATFRVSDPAATAVEPSPEVRSWGWHLLQISSWMLVVLLPLHVISIWLVHDPGRMGVAFYLDRWRSGPWRILDWLFFVLALAHGGLGLDGVLTRRFGDRRARIAIGVTLGLVLGGLALALSARIFSLEVA